MEGIKEMESAGAKAELVISGEQISRSKEQDLCGKEELLKQKRGLELIFQGFDF